MLDFPNTPTTGQVFTSGPVSWKWDGVKWLANTPVLVTGAAVITVSGSLTLPTNQLTVVNVANSTAAPITLTLPVATLPDQTYRFKDINGNAGTYPITIAATSSTIDGFPSYQLLADYMSAEIYWMGSNWGTR